MPQFLKYFPLTKVDEKTHTISGVATAEEPDKDGELCDYEGAKKAYADWSKEASESTKSAGQEVSYGNIRVQHTLEIGGKVKAPVIFDDATKSVHLDTEPENDGIFTKAKKGFIRGFSHAGDYEWRRCNECKTELPRGNHCPKCKKTVIARYKPVLSEVSYVDNPCLKLATFALVKADGSTELKKFSEGSSAMEQTSGIADPAIDIPALTADITKSVLEQLGKRKEETASARLARAAKAVETIVGKAAAIRELDKGMYQVSRFAELLSSLASLQAGALYERDSEADESALPEELLENLEALVETFLAMAEEEAHELTAPGGERGMYMSQEATDLAKAAKKTLASHFKKAAAHHEKMAAHHSEMQKAHEKKAEASKDDKGAESFHKAMSKSHEASTKANEAHAEHLKQMADCYDGDAQKAAGASDDKPLEKKEPAGTDKKEPAAASDVAKTEPDANLEASMHKMLNASIEKTLAEALGRVQNSDEFKKAVDLSVASKIAESLGGKIAPEGVKVAGQTLVARPGESLLSKAATEDLNDTGL